MTKFILSVASAILLCTACSTSQKASGTASSDATKWFSKKDYLNGLQIEPHPATNKAEFARQYNANKELWDQAFAYLKNTDLKALPKGKYTIVPDKVTVSVTEDSTKNFDKTTWESHRKMVDIQYIISGEEKMGFAPVSTAKVTKPYDEKRDAANYEVDGKYFVSSPDKMFIFFPTDAHRPNITTTNNLPDKKIVIKIAAVQ